MKICRKCLSELFDRDTICPTCKNNSFIDNESFDKIRSEIMLANKRKLNSLLKNPEYQSVYDYIQKKSNYERPDILNLSDDKTIEVCPSIFKKEQSRNPTKPTPKCPICNSTNLSKISTIKKATKIGLFGIFGAGDIGKTYKCNNCGSKF